MVTIQLQKSGIRSRIAKLMNSKTGSTFFYILVCSRNCFEYLERCLNSIREQTYNNYQVLFVDDASSYSDSQKKQIKDLLKGHIVRFNKKRVCAAKNIYTMLHLKHLKKEAVVLNLDGDDWLADSEVLQYLDHIYSNNACWYTYGNCILWFSDRSSTLASSAKIGLNKPYSKQTMRDRSFRKDVFFPLHPKTWRLSLFLQLKKSNFLDERGNWLKFASDMMIFYPFLELHPYKLLVIKKVLYVYNCATKHSDNKENAFELIRTELLIRQRKKMTKI